MIERKKHRHFMVIGLLSLFAVSANAAVTQVQTRAASQTETCEQIRAQIKEQTGVLVKPDLKMLAKVGANKQCRFTAAEAYRAAYGDKPLPKSEPRTRRDRHRDGDDD